MKKKKFHLLIILLILNLLFLLGSFSHLNLAKADTNSDGGDYYSIPVYLYNRQYSFPMYVKKHYSSYTSDDEQDYTVTVNTTATTTTFPSALINNSSNNNLPYYTSSSIAYFASYCWHDEDSYEYIVNINNLNETIYQYIIYYCNNNGSLVNYTICDSPDIDSTYASLCDYIIIDCITDSVSDYKTQIWVHTQYANELFPLKMYYSEDEFKGDGWTYNTTISQNDNWSYLPESIRYNSSSKAYFAYNLVTDNSAISRDIDYFSTQDFIFSHYKIHYCVGDPSQTYYSNIEIIHSEELNSTNDLLNYNYAYLSSFIIIDCIAPTPIGTLRGVDNGGITNSNVSFSWSESNYTATLNGSSYASGTTISAEGQHSILLNHYGSTTTYTFTIDKTAPIGTLYDKKEIITSGAKTGSNVSFSWSESNCTATLDGASYTSGTEISAEGQHSIVLTDLAGNSTTYTFTIDKTAPQINMKRSDNSSFADGAIINNYPYFSAISAQGYTLSVIIKNTKTNETYDWTSFATNNVIYVDSRNTLPLIESTYFTNKNDCISYIQTNEQAKILEYSNYQTGCGNIYSTQIDKAQLGLNYFVYNSYIWFDKTDLNNYIQQASSNYCKTINNPKFEYDGSYIITATDYYGSICTKEFTIDITAPAGQLNGVDNGGITGSNVSFSWSESNCTATLDGASYTSGTEISAEGSHFIVLTDLAGNSSTYTFTIDKTAPVGQLNGVVNGGITNSNVSFTWDEIGATATLDGASYTKNTLIPNSKQYEGQHSIVLTDLAGNSSTYTFTIDKTAPVGQLNGVVNGGITNSNVSFTWDEIGATATLDGASYTKNTLIPNSKQYEGQHSIVLTDLAGNSTTYTFIIDITGPIGTLRGVDNGGVTNSNVSFSWSESNCTATLNGASYTSRTEISAEGSYTIILCDSLGNSSTYTFTIYKTAPVGQLNGVDNGGATNSNVSFSWSESNCTATLNGASYTSGTEISAEGSYTIILCDSLGNSSTYTFTIDKTAPIGTLRGVDNGGVTNSNVSFSWSESNCTATLDGASYTSRTEISAEGSYTIILCDSLGNSNTYTFTIDKTAPVGYFKNLSNQLVLGNKVESKIYFNYSIKFYCDEPNTFATLNSYTYNLGTEISAEGSYTIILCDALGNSSTYTFTIDKTAPTENYNFIRENYNSVISTWFETYDYTLNQNSYAKGQNYSFDNFNDAKQFAYIREYNIVEQGLYQGGAIQDQFGDIISDYDITITPELNRVYYIYRSTSNYNNKMVYFSEINLETALQKYAELSVAQKYIIETKRPALPYPGDAIINSQNVLTDNIYIDDSFEFEYKYNDVILIINGITSNYTTPNLYTGINIIIEQDYAGNQCVYYLIYDNEPPKINCFDLSGNSIDNTNINNFETAYFNKGIIISLDDDYDANAVLSITFNKKTTYIIGGEFTCNESGVYQYHLTDKAGNEKIGRFYISLETPSISISENLDSTNRLESFEIEITNNLSFLNITALKIEFKAQDEDDYIQLSNDNYGKIISTDNLSYNFATNGTYLITINDNFGRVVSQEYTFTKSAPVGTLYTKGGSLLTKNITNLSVYFTWTDTTCFAYYKYNNSAEVEYTKGNYLNDEGDYVIYLRDIGNNTSIYSFTIDKTAPSGQLWYIDNENQHIKLDDNSKTNFNVYFLFNDSKDIATYSKNKSDQWTTYTNEIFNLDGIYSIRLSDLAGNSTTYTFTIDKTAPVIVIKSSSGKILKSNSIINENVSFTWSESNCTAFLNKENYKKGTYISEENKYILQVEDEVGNINIVYITIDKTAPVGQLNGVVNGGITNSNVSFSWNEIGATATLNGTSYTSGTTISAEGFYTIILCDSLGNSSTYTFTVDKTAPVGQLNGVVNGGMTNSNVSFSWSESNCTATLNGNEYTKRSLISAEDSYIIILCDSLGNSSTYTFTIDKTAPIGTLRGVDNGGATNSNVSFSWSESNCTATLDGASYTNGTEISAEGQHSIVLTDLAGNSSTYTFTVDKTAPVGQLNGVVNGGMTNSNVSFSWSESNCTATLNGNEYTKRSLISAEGQHSIVLTDLAGNSTTYTFIIDITGPIGQLNGVDNGGATNSNVSFSWSESNCTATLNNTPYLSGSDISAEGSYTIILCDTLGNSSTYTFTIDMTGPIGQLNGVDNGGATNSNVSFSWSESNCTATLNGASYTNGTEISAEGSYTIILCDSLGNSTTYTFTIDITAPVGQLNGVDNGGATNSNVSFSWSESNCTATLNGASYTSGTEISAEGMHSIVLTDLAGNSNTYTFSINYEKPTGIFNKDYIVFNDYLIFNSDISFVWDEIGATATLNGASYISGTTISAEGIYLLILTNQINTSREYNILLDKTAPVGQFNGVDNGGATNSNVSFSWSESNCTATLNGASYTNGTEISAEGMHSIVLTDLAGNSTTYTFIIDITGPAGTLRGVDNGGVTNSNVSFSWDESNCTATLDGASYTNETEISAEGQHSIVLTDLAGNSTTYTFTIDKTAPIGSLNGNITNNTTNLDISFIWDEIGATATLNGTSYTSGTTISAEGFYTIILCDALGNSTTYTFTIDKTAPVGQLNGVVNEEMTNSNVSFSWSESNCTAYLNFSNYTSGTEISAEGQHSIVLMDLAGNSSTYTFTIDITAPVGQLNGVDNGGATNSNVSFSWDESNCTAYLNFSNYTSGSDISAEGQHSIVLTDLAGNSSTYTFTIDKTAPVGQLNGVVNGGATNSNVSFSWSELNCTATLNGNEYTKRSLISAEDSYIIILCDSLGNSTTYTFTIDKTAPVGQLNGVDNGGATNSNVSFSWSELNCTATLDGTSYTSGTEISAEGEHSIVLTDLAGNSTTYTFTIDKTAPKITNLPSNNKINIELNLKFDEKIPNLTIIFTDIEGITNTENYSNIKNIYLKDNGIYKITMIDNAGNEREEIVEIFKKDIKISITTNDNSVVAQNNKNYIIYNEAFSLSEFKNYTVVLNNEIYLGQTLNEIGKYEFVISDEYGNTLEFNVEIQAKQNKNNNLLSSNVSTIILISLGIITAILIITKFITANLKRKRNFNK